MLKKVYYLSYESVGDSEPLTFDSSFTFGDLSDEEELTLAVLANRHQMHLYCELIAEE